jgi:DNA polymerase V
MIALVDCNNFYASCERVFRPDLKKQPIVVLSNNDGCIIARSNEAKAIGIRMGEPAYKRKEDFKKHNVHIFSTNFHLYGDMSNRVMSILRKNSKDIEIYSIDEAFLDCQDGNLKEYGVDIKKKVIQWTGIPVCVGIAETKVLAKLANHIAKKHTKSGVFILKEKQNILDVLKKTNVGEIWGIGSRSAKLLNNYGIYNAFELISLDESWIKRKLSVVGLRIVHELKGIKCFDLDNKRQIKKNICTSRSFGTPTSDYNHLSQAISTFAVRCSEKLRKQQSSASAIKIFIYTNPFNPRQKQYYGNITLQLDQATNDNQIMIHEALKGLKSIYKEGYIYKKAGVIVGNLIPNNQIQLNLFDNLNNRNKYKKISTIFDKINNSMGKDKIRIAVQGFDRKWQMKQEQLSPAYTTRIEEILTIKI